MPQERAERRREQFLEAGLEVFAAKGWAAATVLDICHSARLSQRYFYELFPNRVALFLAVTDRIADEVEAAIRAAASVTDHSPQQRARGVLETLIAYFGSDPRTVRVSLVESLAAPEFRAHRARLLTAFSALAAQLMRALHPHPSRANRRSLELSAAVLSGGVAEALVAAVTDHPLGTDEELLEHLTRLYSAAATLSNA